MFQLTRVSVFEDAYGLVDQLYGCVFAWKHDEQQIVQNHVAPLRDELKLVNALDARLVGRDSD